MSISYYIAKTTTKQFTSNIIIKIMKNTWNIYKDVNFIYKKDKIYVKKISLTTSTSNVEDGLFTSPLMLGASLWLRLFYFGSL